MRQARASAAGFAQCTCQLGTLMIELGTKVEFVLGRQCFLVFPDRPFARRYDLYLMLGRRRNVGNPTIRQSGATFCHRKVGDSLMPL